MKTIISNGSDLMHQINMLNLQVGDSVQTVCRELFDQGATMHEKVVLIKISSELVAGSYISNPAMFAQTLKMDCPYPSLQSYLRDGYLIVRAAQSRKSTTFKGKVRAALERHNEYTARRINIPKSYRRRPSLLSSILTDELSQTVCHESVDVNTFIRWYFKD